MSQTQQSMIDATVTCIEEYGLENLTIRKIAEKANVNSAAISYYFRSKQDLIDQVMEITLKNAFQWDDFIYVEELPIEEELFEIFSFLAKKALIYHNLSRAHLTKLSQQFHETGTLHPMYVSFFEKISHELARKTAHSIESAKINIMMMFSWFFSLFSADPNIYTSLVSWDCNNEEQIDRMIRIMIELFIS